jgi:hypothetical protein
MSLRQAVGLGRPGVPETRPTWRPTAARCSTTTYFTIPHTGPEQTWRQEIDTFEPTATASAILPAVDGVADLGPRSLAVLRAQATP